MGHDTTLPTALPFQPSQRTLISENLSERFDYASIHSPNSKTVFPTHIQTFSLLLPPFQSLSSYLTTYALLTTTPFVVSSTLPPFKISN